MASLNCRLCAHPLSEVFIDLGSSPPSNSYLTSLDEPEVWLPLTVFICTECLLVQLPQYETPNTIFGKEYPYLSGFSRSWIEHTKAFATSAVERYHPKLVVEVASNDGTTLKHFKALGAEVVGIEPAPNVAQIAESDGIPTIRQFLGETSGSSMGLQADLVHGANVFAHVPDLHDFIAGLKAVCAPHGVVTLEFPSVMSLVAETQFDTIYHEHFSYFSLHTAAKALHMHGLAVIEVEWLPTHGGSLRLHATQVGVQEPTASVQEMLATEQEMGHSYLARPETRRAFQQRVQQIKRRLLLKLLETKLVIGFGAPAKATTLLNYCGIKPDLLPFTTDDNPIKQGKFMPGSRIPIRPVEALLETDATALVLPWNIKQDAIRRIGARPLIFP